MLTDRVEVGLEMLMLKGRGGVEKVLWEVVELLLAIRVALEAYVVGRSTFRLFESLDEELNTVTGMGVGGEFSSLTD